MGFGVVVVCSRCGSLYSSVGRTQNRVNHLHGARRIFGLEGGAQSIAPECVDEPSLIERGLGIEEIQSGLRRKQRDEQLAFRMSSELAFLIGLGCTA